MSFVETKKQSKCKWRFCRQLPWESSEEQPREMRIHIQRVFALPSRSLPPADNMPFAPPTPMHEPQEQNEQSTVLHQFVPQPAPTQELDQPEIQKIQMNSNGLQMGQLPWGLSPADLHAIHQAAEEATLQHDHQQQIEDDMQQVKSIVNTLAAAAEAEEGSRQDERVEPQQEAAERVPRTLLLPQDPVAEERPHYMQPRSVRSVDALLHREKRVKRCACSCA